MLVDERDFTEACALALLYDTLEYGLSSSKVDSLCVLLLLINRRLKICNSLVQQHNLLINFLEDQLHLFGNISASDHRIFDLSEVEIHDSPI